MTIQGEISRPDAWRISMSGMSIKTGWGDDKRIIAKAPCDGRDMGAYQRWLADAEAIVTRHNAALPPETQND